MSAGLFTAATLLTCPTGIHSLEATRVIEGKFELLQNPLLTKDKLDFFSLII